MITKMFKYSFLTFHQDYNDFLELLGNIGVLHIKEKAEGIPEDEEISSKIKLQQQIKETVKYLSMRKVSASEIESVMHSSNLVDEVKNLRGQLELKKADLQNIQKEINLMQPWGNFSWDTIDLLHQAGSKLQFFSCNKSKFDEQWKNKYYLFEVDVQSSNIYFIIVSALDEKPVIEAEILNLPKQNLKDLIQTKTNIEVEIQNINDALDKLATWGINKLNEIYDEIKYEIDFRTVGLQASSEADHKLKLIEGWVPEEKEEELIKELSNSNTYFVKSKTTLEDNVPIKLKNNKFSKLFEMIGEMYSLPNHKELDLTPYYAPFYAIFFGFCLGDAGYGLLLMSIGLVMSWKGKKEWKPIMPLVVILGFSTIIFGLIGGTFFGMNLYEQGIGPYGSLNERFALQGKSINDHLFTLSLILGAIQIIFGMMVKAGNEWKQLGYKYALGTLGWIFFIIGNLGVYLLSQTVLDGHITRYLYYFVFSVSGVFILFLNNPEKNVFINFGLGLYNVYNMATGILGDLLSYIRLFALGISSAILGYVFNSLAFDISPDIPVLRTLVIVLILLFGHGINLFMAVLGSFVHPMRLTLVEFYKNAGFTGGGIKYNPFKKIKNNNI
ncbi:MAG: V-type ATP synthase subunit I [Prolixibacteraceae bacterium]